MQPELSTLLSESIALLTALALGMLVGLERGWRQREHLEGERVAGIRTFGFVSLAGAFTALLARESTVWLLPAGLLALGFIATQAYRQRAQTTEDVGLTTVTVLLLVFLLGAAVVMGHTVPAAATAVVVAWLLSLKEPMHAALRQFERRELEATLRLALISVVVLPLLPRQDFGPFNAINLYEFWWMVVLVAGLSFIGYFATRILGTRLGALATGLAGGLASSTAVTLSLSRAHRARADSGTAAGILAACAVMYLRVLVLVVVVNAGLLPHLALPMALGAAVAAAGALLFWRLGAGGADDHEPRLRNPFRISEAIAFGLVLVAVSLAAAWLEGAAGTGGVYAVAAASGLADVDALTLSVSRMQLSTHAAVVAIAIAAVVNSQVKGALTLAVGGRRLGARVWPVLALGGLAVVVAAWAGGLTGQ